MSKVIPLSYSLIVRKGEYVAKEDGLPLPDQLTIFYNQYTDSYEICTLDELEGNFRYLRNEFGELIDQSTDDPVLDTQLREKFLFTHWTPAPPFPGIY